MKWELIKKSLITTIALGAVGLSVSAQEDPLLNVTNNIVSTDQIDVDGLFNKPKQVSEADKIQHLRRQLEQKHEQMMRKKVEDMRLEEERKIARKLQKALSGQLKAMDSVSSTQSAMVLKLLSHDQFDDLVSSTNPKLSAIQVGMTPLEPLVC